MNIQDSEKDLEDTGPSKSQIKREMLSLQKLGEELAGCSNDILSKCDLPENLLSAIEVFQRLPNKHGAKRRQIQFIGKLMRPLDEETLQLIEQHLHQHDDIEKKQAHEAEQLRERLLDGDTQAMDLLIARYPGLEIQQLRQLIRQALKEREQNRTPVSARKIYKLLREIIALD